MKEALLIIDMINNLDFPEGKKLLRHTMPVAKNILRLRDKLRKKGAPIIYVNDNFGHWQSSWSDVYNLCSAPDSLGADIAHMLKPEEKDYFILKPKHSGFYSTSLDILLSELKIKKLIITGIAGNICVLFTANDAHMRGFETHVPSNCIASNTKTANNAVLKFLKEVFNIKTGPL